MALTNSISQIVASSFNAVVAAGRKPTNQWKSTALFDAFESQGFVDRIAGGPQIEVPLDYRRNPGTSFLAADLDPIAMGKTEVVGEAVYDKAILQVPVIWSYVDDASNPEENQKIDFVKALMANSLDSHDDIIEQALFGTTTTGFLGLQTLIADNGQGTVGGLNSATDTFWRNIAATFALAGTDMIAKLTLAYLSAAKGTGGLEPSLLVSDATTQATFEATQQIFQRYEGQDFKVGAKTLAFKNAKYIYSQYGTARVYMLNPKVFKLVVYKNAFRQKGKEQEINNALGLRVFMWSVCQAIVTARSRVAVVVGA